MVTDWHKLSTSKNPLRLRALTRTPVDSTPVDSDSALHAPDNTTDTTAAAAAEKTVI